MSGFSRQTRQTYGRAIFYGLANMQKLIALNEHGNRIGQHHPRAKLLDREVDQVLELIEEGFSYSQVAEKMQLSKSGVAHIATGRRRCQNAARLVLVSVPD